LLELEPQESDLTLDHLEGMCHLLESDPSSLEHTESAEEYVLTSSLDYFKMKVFEQALPNFYDGLLPTRRRLINSMRLTGNSSTKKRSLSSIITATSTTAYIAAGDTYSVLCGMGSRFHNQFRYVDTEGNFGTLDGNSAAADRYTYVRLSKIAEEVFLSLLTEAPTSTPKDGQDEIVKRTIAYNPKYWEESYLPARVPTLLLNGSNGIAVGVAQTFPRMEYKSVLSNLKSLLKGGEINWVKAQTFAYPTTPMVISSREKNIQALKTGHGSIKFRVRHEEIRNRNKVLTGIRLLSVVPNLWINNIHDAYNAWKQDDRAFPFNKKYDGSSQESVDIELTLMPSRRPKPNEEAKFLKQMFKKLKLESSVTVNMLAINKQRLVDYDYESLMRDWIEERINIHKRHLSIQMRTKTQQKRKALILNIAQDHLSSFTELLKEGSDKDVKDWFTPHLSAIDEKPLTRDETSNLLSSSLNSLRKRNKPDLTKLDDEILTLKEESSNEELIRDFIIKDVTQVEKLLSKGLK